MYACVAGSLSHTRASQLEESIILSLFLLFVFVHSAHFCLDSLSCCLFWLFFSSRLLVMMLRRGISTWPRVVHIPASVWNSVADQEAPIPLEHFTDSRKTRKADFPCKGLINSFPCKTNSWKGLEMSSQVVWRLLPETRSHRFLFSPWKKNALFQLATQVSPQLCPANSNLYLKENLHSPIFSENFVDFLCG